MYCPKCGRRFNPNASMEETVSMGVAISPEDGLPTPKPVVEEEDDASGFEERFGDYDIISEVARGGMGVVYRARQRTLKRIVALKVLRGGDVATEEELERFMREAKAAASLTHPNIVPIHDLSAYKGKHFFTMDFIEGTALDRIIENGPLTPYQACEYAETIARAIEYAHKRGIIHRDLKPANIIIDKENRPMLTDFGLAVNLSNDVQSQRMTRTGAVMGTIPYIPPEQAAGKIETVDERSDVYSLGAVLYEMITGRPPFQGDTQYELLRRVIHQEPTTPRTINPKISMDVETITLKCLEKDPDRRYSSAAELADDCRAFLHGEVIMARPATRFYRFYRQATRNKNRLALAGTLALLVISLLLFSTHMRKEQKKAAEIKTELTTTQIEKKEAQKEAQKYKEENEQKLRRYWRPQFSTTFEKNADFSYKLDPAYNILGIAPFVRRDPNIAVAKLNPLPEGAPLAGTLGITTPFPVDFRLVCRLRLDQEKPGTLVLLANTDRVFRKNNLTQVVTLGAPGHPGAMITKGDVLLAENPAFSLNPDQWYEIEFIRKDGLLSIYVDSKGDEQNCTPVLQTTETSPPVEQENSYLCVGVTGGQLEVDQLSVYVLGLSRTMVHSLLEVADSLRRQDPYLALKLYERVAIENTAEKHMHVAALRGFANCLFPIIVTQPSRLSGGKKPANSKELLEGACKALVEQIAVARRSDPAESDFLFGLAYAGCRSARDNTEAVKYFQLAAEKSQVPVDAILKHGSPLFIGPFEPRDADGFFIQNFPPEWEFDPDTRYAGKGGPLVGWTPFSRDAVPGDAVALPGNLEHNAIYYVRAPIVVNKPLRVALDAKVYTGMGVWVNGEQILPRNSLDEESAAESPVTVHFRKGENVILVKLYARKDAPLPTITLTPELRYRYGMYGLLSQLEEALVRIKLSQYEEACRKFIDMQRQGTAAVLAENYQDVISSGNTLEFVLKRIDALLGAGGQAQNPASSDTAFTLLEAMNALYPASGKDLALRYHRLALAYAEHGNADAAISVLNKTISLAPGWHMPWINKAEILYSQGKTGECFGALDRAGKDMPESVELHLAIARFCLTLENGQPLNLSKAEEAASVANTAAEHKNPAALELLAQALFHKTQYKEALDAVQKALDLEATEPRRMLMEKIIERLVKEAPPSDPYPRREEPAFVPTN